MTNKVYGTRHRKPLSGDTKFVLAIAAACALLSAALTVVTLTLDSTALAAAVGTAVPAVVFAAFGAVVEHNRCL